MASRIEPEKTPKPPAAAKPVPPKSAAPKPTGAAKPAAKPAAAPKPAAAKPAGPPPAAGKPGGAAAQRPAPHGAEEEGDAEANALASGLLKNTPAWAVSMLVHVIALLAMALMVTPPPEKEKVHVITSSAPEVDEDFEELEPEQPVENVPQTDAVADVAVPTDVNVVEDVKVISTADDLDAAPLAVELSDFGSETAPAADVAATIGVAGGTGTGLGGRAKRAELAGTTGAGAGTATAVDRALKWFIEHQMDDGGWSFDLTECPKCRGKCSHSGDAGRSKDRAGATAMALLPFLGRGYTHKEGPYKMQIERGIAFLATQAANGQGKVYGPGGSMYSQGLAGIALSESYGMTQDNRLAQPTQLALNFIMSAQDPRGGGWRYSPGQPGDTSAVGWQIMALKSGNMAYLQVDPLTIKKAVEFLDSVQDDSGSAYGYADPGKGLGTSAVGLLCRMYLGWKKDNAALQRGVERLAKAGPTADLYYSYYATQIMHHMEGDMWVAWNDKMKKMLLDAQAKDGHEAGSWYDGVNGGNGAHAAGRVYCTSLATMILEVYYRHLPIYRTQSVDEEFKE